MQWLELLRGEVGKTSQSKAAARIGFSPAVVNQVLSGKYRGNRENVAAAMTAAQIEKAERLVRRWQPKIR